MLIVVIVVLRIRCNHYLKLSENQVLEGAKGAKAAFQIFGKGCLLNLETPSELMLRCAKTVCSF